MVFGRQELRVLWIEGSSGLKKDLLFTFTVLLNVFLYDYMFLIF